jgi:hypothetical protein
MPYHEFLIFHYKDKKSNLFGSFSAEYNSDSAVEIRFDDEIIKERYMDKNRKFADDSSNLPNLN